MSIKGQDHGNCVSMNANQSSILMLQETCMDTAGSLVVYAPVDIPTCIFKKNGTATSYIECEELAHQLY